MGGSWEVDSMLTLRALASVDPLQATQHLARTWWDADLPGLVPGSDHPPLLEWLWANAAEDHLFGTQNRLVSKRDVLERDDCVLVVEENQNVWQAGFRPDGTDDPPAVFHHGGTVTSTAITLNELLLRLLLEEAVTSAPLLSSGSGVGLERVMAELEGHLLFQPVLDIDDIGNQLPAVWGVGLTIVLGFQGSETYTLLFAGTHAQHLRETPLADLCDWGPLP